MRISATSIKQALKEQADPEKAAFFPKFFKSEKGEYAEGDKFLGVTVPKQRRIARQFREAPLNVISSLLNDRYHESRLTGVLMLVDRYQRARSLDQRQAVVEVYYQKMDQINNWDLVDSSAHKILGPHVDETDAPALLDELASTDHLWRQRIAMIATLYFIKQDEFDHTIRIASTLLHHSHDLIHKAVGWMLREMGKRDERALRVFLKVNDYPSMPRTALRYAIEKLPDKDRKRYLAGKA